MARCIASVGDAWAFLIVRDAMLDVKRFSGFQLSLNIAKNVLSDRLNSLVDDAVLERVDVGVYGTGCEYHLTQKGRDLFPVIIAMRLWSHRWVEPEELDIVEVRDKDHQQQLPYMAVLDVCGKPLELGEVTLGP